MFRVPKTPEGSPYPLGATWLGDGVNFAVFAADADHVELCLFDSPDDEIESRRVEMVAVTDQVWHCFVPGAEPGQLYGYRVSGPWRLDQGLRFNPHKLLLDPYARGIGRGLRWDDALFGFPAENGLPRNASDTDLLDERDSAPYAALGAVIENRFDWDSDDYPRVPWCDTVIYELHVKGFTKLNQRIHPSLRGTYLGLASEPSIEYLLGLGVTAVELLPVHYHVDEARLEKLGLRNYWGYNTLGFFAPDPAYAADPSPAGCTAEFKQMVKSLHAAGLEVLLDVVYNHTAEGNERGPTLSLRGLANHRYYRLEKDPRRYQNYTGTGNTLDTRDPRSIQLVLDSLRYWVEQMHVDGFRFDLLSALGRESDGFDPGSGFFDAVQQDPVLSRVKLIAEPWDADPGGYAVGRCPTGWSEWNGKYRDDVRQFWKGDHGKISALATRFAGSSDYYNHSGRAPRSSINFLTSHDGFTLEDLVSYERKHNMANGEHNRDGENHNNSRNYGVEGPTHTPEVVELRERQKRNLLATLILSAGTPMLTAGDEIGRTQRGNNNAYCQDNEISWVDWRLSADDEALAGFTRMLLALRRAEPALRRKRFFTGQTLDGTEFKDISWYAPEGHEMLAQEWRDAGRQTIGVLIGPDPGGDPLLFLLNASSRAVDFRLPPALAGGHWGVLFDTAKPDDAPAASMRGVVYPLKDHSFVALQMIEDLP
ncbi:MAG: glycogen debranching protein GlgX [Bryobacterales bacterium]|nr:glycogen debranching protein GlgX [Acidobacteriota bacterium]MCB9384104.1 glycogen debranching protein GlgX [Bryobacterales bacterium]